MRQYAKLHPPTNPSEIAKKILDQQMDIEEKKNLADMVIDNSKDLKHLQNEVERIIGEII